MNSVPEPIRSDPTLSQTDKNLYILIADLSQRFGYCWAEDQRLTDMYAARFGTAISVSTVRHSIAKLSKTYLIRAGRGKRRTLKPNYDTIVQWTVEHLEQLRTENAKLEQLLHETAAEQEKQAALHAQLLHFAQMPAEAALLPNPCQTAAKPLPNSLYNEEEYKYINIKQQPPAPEPATAPEPEPVVGSGTTRISFSEKATDKTPVPEAPDASQDNSAATEHPASQDDITVLAETFKMHGATETFVRKCLRITPDYTYVLRIFCYAATRYDWNFRGYVIRCLRDPEFEFPDPTRPGAHAPPDADTTRPPPNPKAGDASKNTPPPLVGGVREGGTDPDHTDLTRIDTALKTHLEQIVNRPSFNTWIRPIRLSSLDGGAVFTVPDEVFVYWLGEYYTTLIQDALDALLPMRVSVEFEL